jgi:hypothetical protein
LKIGLKRTIWLGAALFVGLLNGAIGLYFEFQNNNQGEYFDPLTGVVDVPYAVLTFAVVAVPTVLLMLLAELVLYQFIRLASGYWHSLKS